jgi:hypothetical protein
MGADVLEFQVPEPNSKGKVCGPVRIHPKREGGGTITTWPEVENSFGIIMPIVGE